LLDPEGILYYDSENDLTGTSKKYVVKAEKTSDGTAVAHVIFYISSQSSPYAEVCLSIPLSFDVG